jgi:tRNA A-37 threonylcarbamoyl transferase component Bud32
MTRGGQTPGAAGAEDFAGVPVPGEILASKYEVERVLGVGGMGVVVAARHIQLGQRVAIKFMRVEAAQHAHGVSRFLREARAAVALSSEHVTKVLDVGTLDSGAPYMVMEYLSGADLGQVLKANGPLNIADTVAAVLQACEAIAEAHMLGIVHRDLKPSNIFATTRRDGTPLVKVLDFGISKTIELNTQGVRENLTASGLVIGSPLYMSPEQLRSAKAADARSDIWSLGVILFELLTGEAPFAGETLGETLSRIVAEPAPSVRTRRPDIPEGLAAVIAQCLERDIDRRIQNVAELAVKLAPFAPREASISVERIARVAASGDGQAAADQRLAEREAGSVPSRYGSWGSNRAAPPAAVQTEPAWLKSGVGSSDSRPAFRRRFGSAIAVVAVIALAAGLGLHQFRGRAVGRDPSSATVAPAAPAEVVPAAARNVPAAEASTAVALAPLPPPAEVPRPEASAPAADLHAPPDAGPPLKAPTKSQTSPPRRQAPKPAPPSDDDLLLQRR